MSSNTPQGDSKAENSQPKYSKQTLLKIVPPEVDPDLETDPIRKAKAEGWNNCRLESLDMINDFLWENNPVDENTL